jgi:hypothetical protein
MLTLNNDAAATLASELEGITFGTPDALRAVCLARPAGEMPTARAMFAEYLSEKMAGMQGLSAGNAADGKRWQKEIINGNHDAALRVMLTMGIPLNFFLRTVRGGAESFNFYAIPKCLMAARNMLSASPLWGNVGMPATMRGTILSVLRDAGEVAKLPHAVYLNDYMNDHEARGIAPRPRPYSSGATQSSSSAHALAALGMLNVTGKGAYSVPQGAARGMLETLCGMETQDGN